jgi:uncharacterized protein YjdB
MAQQTSMTIDNQTPGWLSSKIGYGDQQTVEELKVTGYINGTDINFLVQLQNDQKLRSLDLSDVSIVKGGDKVYISRYNVNNGSGVYYDGTTELQITDDNHLYRLLFLPFKKLQKLSTPKAMISTDNPVLINADTVVLNGSFKKIVLSVSYKPSTNSKTPEIPKYKNEVVEIGEGLDSVAIYSPSGDGTVDVVWEFKKLVLPSTLTKFARVQMKGGNIVSYIEHPENMSISGSNRPSSATFKLEGDTIFIPQGTIERYKNSRFKSMTVFVEMNAPTSIQINQPQLKMYKGDKEALLTTTEPEEVFYKELKWESSDESIVAVNQNGEVTAMNHGTAIVTVSSVKNLEAKAQCVVTAFEHTIGINISATEKTLNVGDIMNLTATTLPIGISDNRISWSSSDASVAAVNEEGQITAISPGSCVIKATSVDGGYDAECNITVAKLPESITLDKYEATITVGKTEKISAIISPDDATNKTLTWMSNNTEVATVDATGLIIAHKAGTATITATSNSNESVKATCEVTVIQPVTGVKMNHSSLLFDYIGETACLEATVLPEDATNKKIRWTSSDESVCIVSNGMIVAVGMGTSVVIATTEDGGFMAICIVTVTSATDISSVEQNEGGIFQVFGINGAKRTHLQKGINIIQFKDGTKKKVIVK